MYVNGTLKKQIPHIYIDYKGKSKVFDKLINITLKDRAKGYVRTGLRLIRYVLGFIKLIYKRIWM